MATIRIRLNDYEKLGGHSLSGMFAEARREAGYPDDDTLIIEMEQTSHDWRKEHGGADSIVMPEYTPMCLMMNLQDLIQDGVRVKIVEIPIDPKGRK